MSPAPAPLPLAVVLAASLAWLAVLWAVAAWAERRAAAGRSVVARPTVYALSLAVYCTAWTYYGSVGRAAAGGPAFLAIYLGPTLAMALAWLVLRKMVRIAREQRLTSIADFIASRHGHSRALAALVSAVALVGVVPYVALQLKAIAHGVGLLTGVAVGSTAIAAAAAALLAAFTIAFGTRTLDARERHEGLVAAVAAESVFKLLAFVAVGVFVCWGLFDGPGDIAARVAADAGLAARLLPAAGPGGFDAVSWFALMLLAGLSVLLLPRQFQVAVVENVDERHLRRASWLFPAYLLAINLFVLPIAWGGLLLLGPQADADGFVLALPLQAGQPALALLAYLGGLSAATGMVVVEAIAVGTMVSNDLVLPALLKRGTLADAALAPRLLRVRRVAIVALLALGWLYLLLAGESRSLVSIGLVSFAAVAQFAPALLLGLFWQGGTKAGALAGLAVGAALWAALLLAPALVGTAGVPLAEGLFWSLGANLALYVGVSLWRPPQGAEAAQALRFVGALEQGAGERVFWAGRARPAALVALLERVLGPGRVRAEVALEMDFDRVETREERFDPENQVARSTQSSNETSRSIEGGPVGVGNNLPGAEPGGGGNGNQESRQEETTNFEIGRTLRNVLREHPVTRRLTVAVLVDGVTEAQPDGTTAKRERTPEEIGRIAGLVRNAVGFNEQRGDRVEVVSMRFAEPEEAPREAGWLGLDIPQAVLARLLETAVIGVLILLTLLLVARPVARKLSLSLNPTPALAGAGGGVAGAAITGEGGAALPGQPGDPALPPGERPAGLLGAEGGAGEEQMMNLAHVQGQLRSSSIARITSLVEAYPDESLLAVRRWLTPEDDT